MLEAKDGVCFSFAISFRVYSLELGYSLYSLWPWEGIGGKPSVYRTLPPWSDANSKCGLPCIGPQTIHCSAFFQLLLYDGLLGVSSRHTDQGSGKNLM